ncbi:MAG: ABC-F family ATP-binding cassette domain-containing protein [Spirochaetaceae bacterium]|nr:MAG: ABC-F family ATP-binding cassette domain-containing protein [Spirochaetaceae bacterium]
MSSVILSEVNLSFGERFILKSVNLNLPKGRKLALAGANGSGKSTLMRILIGELKPDLGGVVREKNTRISYMPQSGVQSSSLSLHPRSTVYREVEKAFASDAALENELRDVEQQLAGHREDSPELTRLLERHHGLQEQLEFSGYYRRAAGIERVLEGLGFGKGEFDQQVGSFSQGWQMRISLARVLCEGGDLLLLDEPTNFLDLEARTWLEGFLQETAAGVLVVSHDRYFLDTTVHEVAELYQGNLTIYPGSFSSYERKRIQELEQIAEAYEQQQEEIARTELFIRRFRYKATKARQVQSRIKALERMERIEAPPVHKRLHFSFPQAPRCGRLSVRIEDLAKSYGEKMVFANVSLTLSRGEKWALVGPNGAGKSTLMRLMAGRENADSGTIRYGSGVQLGFYSPEEVENLEEGKTIEELVTSWAPMEMVPHVRSLLGAFLFRGEEVYKAAAVLSGGEKSRLALLRLLLQPANLLFLDEPTNHLDLQSKDILLDALKRYSGTVVFVSHDRNFIDALADRVAEAGGGQVLPYSGDYAYYRWRKNQEEQETVPVGLSGSMESPAIPGASQQLRDQSKAQKREQRRLEREEQELLATLEALDSEGSQLEHLLAQEEVYRDGDRVREIKEQLETIAGQREGLMKRWERVDKQRAEI